MATHEELDLEIKRKDLDVKWADLLVKIGAITATLYVGYWAYEGTNKNIAAQSDQFERRLQAEEKVRVEQRRQDLEARQREYLKSFFERKVAIYMEACELAASIGFIGDNAQRPASMNKFESLYYSRLLLVMDREVNQAAWNLIQEYRKPQYTLSGLQPLTVEFAKRCRESLRMNFPDAIPRLDDQQFFTKPPGQ